jgi:hypothetical protein
MITRNVRRQHLPTLVAIAHKSREHPMPGNVDISRPTPTSTTSTLATPNGEETEFLADNIEKARDEKLRNYWFEENWP